MHIRTPNAHKYIYMVSAYEVILTKSKPTKAKTLLLMKLREITNKKRSESAKGKDASIPNHIKTSLP